VEVAEAEARNWQDSVLPSFNRSVLIPSYSAHRSSSSSSQSRHRVATRQSREHGSFRSLPQRRLLCHAGSTVLPLELTLPSSAHTSSPMQPLTISDIDSPLSGPVFRMQRDLLVGAVAPDETHDDPEGEWRGLGYAAWLLGSSLLAFFPSSLLLTLQSRRR
jgi:hypothetical protein